MIRKQDPVREYMDYLDRVISSRESVVRVVANIRDVRDFKKAMEIFNAFTTMPKHDGFVFYPEDEKRAAIIDRIEKLKLCIIECKPDKAVQDFLDGGAYPPVIPVITMG